jgi:hypothetical protein
MVFQRFSVFFAGSVSIVTAGALDKASDGQLFLIKALK